MLLHMADEDAPQIDPTGPDLVWKQVADFIEGQIRDGKLAPGSRLPAEREMAQRYGVAYLTIRRAVKDLRDRGLLVSVVGRGTYVAKA